MLLFANIFFFEKFLKKFYLYVLLNLCSSPFCFISFDSIYSLYSLNVEDPSYFCIVYLLFVLDILEE